MDLFSNLIKPVFIVACIIIVFLFLYKLVYVKVPVDKAAVITGVGKRKVLIGKGGWKVPFLDSVCYVSLENIPLPINVEALALGDINVTLMVLQLLKLILHQNLSLLLRNASVMKVSTPRYKKFVK